MRKLNLELSRFYKNLIDGKEVIAHAGYTHSLLDEEPVKNYLSYWSKLAGIANKKEMDFLRLNIYFLSRINLLSHLLGIRSRLTTGINSDWLIKLVNNSLEKSLVESISIIEDMGELEEVLEHEALKSSSARLS